MGFRISEVRNSGVQGLGFRGSGVQGFGFRIPEFRV